MNKLSGNHKGWLDITAREIREAGQPVSLDFLRRVVHRELVTATNDGHVTAAENGLDRDDFQAGQRIWIEETVAALRQAKLVETDGDNAPIWVAPQDGAWRVKFGKSTYTIHGRAESAAGTDRHMLGDGKHPGYLLKGWSEVEVEIEVGVSKQIEKGRHVLQVHPLAFAIPPMSLVEQEQVKADIAEHGVRQPLILYPDPNDKTVRGKPKLKVLDGRHRLQFASTLGKPIRVEVFEGTEQEARDLVQSLNLERRHLTKEQRALSIARLYGKQSMTEAEASRIEGQKKSNLAPTVSSEPDDHKRRGKEAYERAWELAGGEASGVTKNAVRQMMEVAEAPETAARIDSGERLTLAEARTAAREERGLPRETKQEARTYPTTIATELARAENHMRTAWDERDGPIGGVAAGVLRKRLGEISHLSTLLLNELERRGQL